MNNVQVFDASKFGSVPANLQAAMAKQGRGDELSAGIAGGFSVISIRGKVFRVKAHGEERVLMDAEGVHPRPSMEVVLVKASEHISKIWYEHGYTEGSSAAPDCFSSTGIRPDPTSPKLQSQTCGPCPHNQWGSRVTNDGSRKGKSCQDSKRLALVPLADLRNEAFGGPMLMRVPPASLAEIKKYASVLNQINFPYYGVATRVSFDYTTEYPALVFSAMRPLTAEEAAVVLELRDSAVTQYILSTNLDEAAVEAGVADAPVAPTAATVFEQPVPVEAVKPSQVGTVANPQPASAPAPAPVVTQQVMAASDDVAPVDPNAEKREAMRAMGLSDAQIDAALGPAPKVPPPVDPNAEKRAAMRAMGLSDVQIDAALGMAPRAGEPPRRTRRSKAEMEALRAQEAAQTAQGAVAAPAQAQTAPTQAAPVQEAVKAEEPQPNGTMSNAATASALPQEFEDMLSGLLPPTPATH